jgi:hypothetical protein
VDQSYGNDVVHLQKQCGIIPQKHLIFIVNGESDATNILEVGELIDPRGTGRSFLSSSPVLKKPIRGIK